MKLKIKMYSHLLFIPHCTNYINNIIFVLKYLHTVSQGDFPVFVSRRHHPKYQQLTVEIKICHLFKVNHVRKNTYVQKHVRTFVGDQMTSRKLNTSFGNILCTLTPYLMDKSNI